MLPTAKMTASSSRDGADAGGSGDPENVCNITHHAPVDWARLHVLAEGHNESYEMNKGSDSNTVQSHHTREHSRQYIDRKTESQRFLDALVLLEGELQAHEIALCSMQDARWQSSGILPPDNPYLALERDGYFLGENCAKHPLEVKAQQFEVAGSQQQVRRLLFTSAVVDSVLPTLFTNYDQRFETMCRASHAAHERNRNLLKYLVESHKTTVGQLDAINITSEFAQKKLSENFWKLQEKHAEMSVQLETAQKSEHVLRSKIVSLTDELLEEKERARQAVTYMVAESDMLMEQLEYYKNLCAAQQTQIDLLSSRRQTATFEQPPEQAVEDNSRMVPDISEEKTLDDTYVVADGDLEQQAVSPTAGSKQAAKFLGGGLTTISERLSENDYALRRSDVSDAGDRSEQSAAFTVDARQAATEKQPESAAVLADSDATLMSPKSISRKPPSYAAVGSSQRSELRINIDQYQGGDKSIRFESAFSNKHSAHRRSNFSFYSSTTTTSSRRRTSISLPSTSRQDGVERATRKRSYADEDDDSNDDGTVPASFSSSSSSSSTSSSASSSPTVSSPVLLVNSDDGDDSSSSNNDSSSDTSGEEIEIIDVSDEKRSSSVRRMPSAATAAALPQLTGPSKEQAAVVIHESGIVGVTSHAHLFTRSPPEAAEKNVHVENSSVLSNGWKPRIAPNPTLLAALANYADDDDDNDSDGVDPWISIEDNNIIEKKTAAEGQDPIRIINSAPPVSVIPSEPWKSRSTTTTTTNHEAKSRSNEQLSKDAAVAGLKSTGNDAHGVASGIRAPRKSAIVPPRNVMLLPAFDRHHHNASAAVEAVNAALYSNETTAKSSTSRSKLKQPIIRKNGAASESSDSISPESEETLLAPVVCGQPTTLNEFSRAVDKQPPSAVEKQTKPSVTKKSSIAWKKHIGTETTNSDNDDESNVPKNVVSASMVKNKDASKKGVPRASKSHETTPATDRVSTRRSLRLQNKASKQRLAGGAGEQSRVTETKPTTASSFDSSSPSSTSSATSSSSPTSPAMMPNNKTSTTSKIKQPCLSATKAAPTNNINNVGTKRNAVTRGRMSMIGGFFPASSTSALNENSNGYSKMQSVFSSINRGAPIGLDDSQFPKKSSSISHLSTPSPATSATKPGRKSVVKKPTPMLQNNSALSGTRPAQNDAGFIRPLHAAIPTSTSAGGFSRNLAQQHTTFLPFHCVAESSNNNDAVVGDFTSSNGKVKQHSAKVSLQQKVVNVNNH